MVGRSPLGDALEESPAPRPGDLIANKYVVEGVVGSGGMGVVLAARHVHLDQRVAIKVLCRQSEPEHAADSTARFFREGRAAAALRSDHVVRVHDVGTLDNGLPYIVMELLKGSDLSAVLSKFRQLPIRHAVECVLQAGSAISEAHRHGIVHRDLKPSNLFVTERSDGTALIKVVDFGISKSLEDSQIDGDLTTTRAVLGSPFYMSPEQVRDSKHVDHRTDIWALGAILHELLSGHPPFEASTLPAACAAIAADSPRPLGLVRGDVPSELEAIVLRCLEKDPAMRYQSVDELVAALRPFSAHALGQLPPRFDEGSMPAAAPRSAEEPTLHAGAGAVTGPTLASVAPPPFETTSHTRSDVPANAVQAPRYSPKAPGDTLDAGVGAVLTEQPPHHTRKLVALVAVGSVLAGGAWLAVARPWSDATPAAAAPRDEAAPPAAAGFALLIESEPTGAEVYERNERLGTTPLALRIQASSVAMTPREFELRREGFESYVFAQGLSTQDLRHAATLTRQAFPPPASVARSAAANPAAATAPAPKGRAARRTTAPEPAPAPEPEPAPTTPPSTGIRLSR